MKTIASLLIAGLALSCLVGCPKPNTIVPAQEPDYAMQLPKGKLGLAKLDPKDYPDFAPGCADLQGLRTSIDNSLDYMSKKSSKDLYVMYGAEFTHDRVVATLRAMAELVDQNPTPDRMNQAIRDKFEVYTSVGWNGQGEVLFTGYYTPIFDASPTPTERFKFPLYKQPKDLVKNPDGTMATKYPARRELETTEKSRLAGLELYYLADPFEVYIVQIQGSAKLRVDGKLVTVGYTADNGQEYHSVALDLVNEGKIPKNQLSLKGVWDFFRNNPQMLNEYTWRNPRFVFFAESLGEPRGCLNEPVTAWRSVATDKEIFPRACVTFIKAGMPKRTGNLINIDPNWCGFACDQDRGGAIRAAGRCDVYMGVGNEAGDMAGREYEKGRLYYLALKPSLVPSYATPATTKPAAPGNGL